MCWRCYYLFSFLFFLVYLPHHIFKCCYDYKKNSVFVVVAVVVVIQVLLFFISLHVDRSKTHPAKHLKKTGKKQNHFHRKSCTQNIVQQMVAGAGEGTEKKRFFFLLEKGCQA